MNDVTTLEEELDTPRELAKALKVDVGTVRNWYRKGLIPARIACGRIYRFNRAEVLQALEKAKGGGA